MPVVSIASKKPYENEERLLGNMTKQLKNLFRHDFIQYLVVLNILHTAFCKCDDLFEVA